MPTTVLYDFDTTGTATSNLINNERHSLTEVNDDTYNLIIPVYAPFYLDNFALIHVNNIGVETTLTEGIDYSLTLPFLGATRSVGKMIYGGISVINAFSVGELKVKYQTLGGPWTVDASLVLASLANINYNPRVTSWDVITNKQTTFPPTNHDVDTSQLKGLEELIAALNVMSNQILSGQTESNTLLMHKLDTDNPHVVSKTQVGLGKVENLQVVSQVEIDDKIEAHKYLTFDMFLKYIKKHNLDGSNFGGPTLEIRSSTNISLGYIYPVIGAKDPLATIPISYADGIVLGYATTALTQYCPDTLQDAEGEFIGYFKAS